MAVFLEDLHIFFLYPSPVPLPLAWACPASKVVGSGHFLLIFSLLPFLPCPSSPFLLETWSHFVALAVL